MRVGVFVAPRRRRIMSWHPFEPFILSAESGYDDSPQTTTNNEPVSPEIVQFDLRERDRQTEERRQTDTWRERLACRWIRPTAE